MHFFSTSIKILVVYRVEKNGSIFPRPVAFRVFFNAPCLTCQPEVLNYVRCTELYTKLCVLY